MNPSKLRRQCHSVVIWNDALYVYGGRRYGECFSDFLKYDLFRKTWTRIECETPGGKVGHTAVVFGDDMFVYGGKSSYAGKRTSDVWKYSFRKNTWKLLNVSGKKPPERSSHTAVVYKESMYVFGGFDEGDLGDFYEFDLKKYEWKEIHARGKQPCERCVHTAVVYKDSMYVFGGENDVFYSDKMCDLYEYNFVQNLWTKIKDSGDIPRGRSAHAAVVIGDYMFVFGGEQGIEYCNDDSFYEYHFPTCKWKMLKQDKINGKRATFGMVSKDNVLYIFGGSNGETLCDPSVDEYRVTLSICSQGCLSLALQKHQFWDCTFITID